MRPIARLMLCLLVLSCSTASAEDYPSRPIRLVIPFAAGGASDSLARLLARHLEKSLGQPVVADNKPGAGGMIAGQFVVRSPQDGYTLLFGTIGTNAILPVIQGNGMSYDSLKDLTAVGLLHELPLVLVVQKSVPATDLRTLITYAKQHPGHLTYGSSGIGSVQHLSAELFNTRAQISARHIPFKGGGAAVPALLGDQISMIFEPIPSALSAVRSGKTLALAVTSAKRAAAWPEVPTFVEQGVSGMEINAWTGLFAPAGTPSAVVERLRRELATLARDPGYIEQLAAAGTSPVSEGFAQAPGFVASEVARWRSAAHQAGIAAN